MRKQAAKESPRAQERERERVRQKAVDCPLSLFTTSPHARGGGHGGRGIIIMHAYIHIPPCILRLHIKLLQSGVASYISWEVSIVDL